MSRSTDPGMQLLFSRRGALSKIARELGLSDAVYLWKQVPLIYVFRVARIARTRPERLRPDFFVDDPLRREKIPRGERLYFVTKQSAARSKRAFKDGEPTPVSERTSEK